MLTPLEGKIQDGRQLQKWNLENDVTFSLVGIKTHVIYQFVLFSA
jgi:hypothetical protein